VAKVLAVLTFAVFRKNADAAGLLEHEPTRIVAGRPGASPAAGVNVRFGNTRCNAIVAPALPLAFAGATQVMSTAARRAPPAASPAAAARAGSARRRIVGRAVTRAHERAPTDQREPDDRTHALPSRNDVDLHAANPRTKNKYERCLL